MSVASLVIPSKRLELAKSRLHLTSETRRELVKDMLGTALSAARSAQHVGLVVVVTADPELADLARRHGACVEPDPVELGLNQALLAGRRRAAQSEPAAPICAMVADLPLVTAGDLDTALGCFQVNPRAVYVADHRRTGTTFLAHPAGCMPSTWFGFGSARAHAVAGFAPIAEQLPGLRFDVDTLADLHRTGANADAHPGALDHPPPTLELQSVRALVCFET